jgi:hypothetical protein
MRTGVLISRAAPTWGSREESVEKRTVELKTAFGQDMQRLGSLLMCQKAMGVGRPAYKKPVKALTEKELDQLVEQQEGWLQSRIVNARILDEIKKRWPILGWILKRKEEKLLSWMNPKQKEKPPKKAEK